jgi:hypothetical protein
MLVQFVRHLPQLTDLGCYVRQLTSLPGFHLLSHRLEVSLHSVHANPDAVDERKRLLVLRQGGSEHA